MKITLDAYVSPLKPLRFFLNHVYFIDVNYNKYIPQPNDAVLATVHHSATDLFYVSLTPHAPLATLPHLAFENATKKTRPQLASGAIVYARVASSLAHNKFQEPELTCIHPQTGKADGMGEIKGGMVFAISRGMAARLLAKKQREEGGVVVLELLGGKWPFEVAVGRNGFLWVDAAGDVRRTLVVGRAITETDIGKLGVKEQEKVVKRLCRELGTET